MKVLFVCSRNRWRSPTAEIVLSEQLGVEALSAGTSPDAENAVSAELIEWADLIVAMENSHKRRLMQRFSDLLKTKRIVVFGIPDKYRFMDPELVRILREKARQILLKV